MPDEARDGRNVAFELSSDLLVCSIVQRNHSTINSACLIISPKELADNIEPDGEPSDGRWVDRSTGVFFL